MALSLHSCKLFFPLSFILLFMIVDSMQQYSFFRSPKSHPVLNIPISEEVASTRVGLRYTLLEVVTVTLSAGGTAVTIPSVPVAVTVLSTGGSGPITEVGAEAQPLQSPYNNILSVIGLCSAVLLLLLLVLKLVLMLISFIKWRRDTTSDVDHPAVQHTNNIELALQQQSSIPGSGVFPSMENSLNVVIPQQPPVPCVGVFPSTENSIEVVMPQQPPVLGSGVFRSTENLLNLFMPQQPPIFGSSGGAMDAGDIV